LIRPSSIVTSMPRPPNSQLSLFGDVFEKIRTDYVEKPDEGKLIEAAVNGMHVSADAATALVLERRWVWVATVAVPAPRTAPNRTEGKLIEAAVNGMLTSLDPHSSYMDAKSFRDMQVQTADLLEHVAEQAELTVRLGRRGDGARAREEVGLGPDRGGRQRHADLARPAFELHGRQELP
jgi:hypothetical protein